MMINRKLKILIIFMTSIGILSFTLNESEEGERWLNRNLSGRHQIEGLKWLIGTWRSVSLFGSSFEIWTVANDSVYTGKGCYLSGRDTITSESISIEQKGNELFYIPTVAGQNDEKPVYFKLTSMKKNEFIFENPAHDFPQKIVYRQLKPDSMVASISGLIKGEMKTEDIPMVRINTNRK